MDYYTRELGKIDVHLFGGDGFFNIKIFHVNFNILKSYEKIMQWLRGEVMHKDKRLFIKFSHKFTKDERLAMTSEI